MIVILLLHFIKKAFNFQPNQKYCAIIRKRLKKKKGYVISI